MGDVHLLSQNDLTRTIAERLTEIWDAYVRVDEESHNTYFTEDYRAVHPDGMRAHRQAVRGGNGCRTDCGLLDRRPASVAVGDDGEIVSYTAEGEVRTETTSG
jgi:hypothetical protein